MDQSTYIDLVQILISVRVRGRQNNLNLCSETLFAFGNWTAVNLFKDNPPIPAFPIKGTVFAMQGNTCLFSGPMKNKEKSHGA